MNSFDRYTKEQAARRTTANFIYLIAMAIDIVLVFLLKDKSGWFRWLWLPLISAALAFICDRARNWSYQPSRVGTLFGLGVGWCSYCFRSTVYTTTFKNGGYSSKYI